MSLHLHLLFSSEASKSNSCVHRQTEAVLTNKTSLSTEGNYTQEVKVEDKDSRADSQAVQFGLFFSVEGDMAADSAATYPLRTVRIFHSAPGNPCNKPQLQVTMPAMLCPFVVDNGLVPGDLPLLGLFTPVFQKDHQLSQDDAVCLSGMFGKCSFLPRAL
ncbi:hypothetical protein Q8A73_019321 [Channa argus]|nr:hypothetical protein Q8A73_019321 [Channa argus]